MLSFWFEFHYCKLLAYTDDLLIELASINLMSMDPYCLIFPMGHICFLKGDASRSVSQQLPPPADWRDLPPPLLTLGLIFFLREGILCLKIFNLFLFLPKRERWEKDRKRNIRVWLPLAHPLLSTCPATQACTMTGN